MNFLRIHQSRRYVVKDNYEKMSAQPKLAVEHHKLLYSFYHSSYQVPQYDFH